MNSWGKLYGVGIGPGDTELLTLKAAKVLNSVAVIFSPRSAPKKESLARRIIEPVLRSTAEVVELDFPMTKDESKLDAHWTKAASEVASVLKAGKDAAFVTLGDPFFYSTYIYLYNKLKKDYPEAQIITLPGISSVFASASAAGTPIAIGEEKVLILPLPNDASIIRPYLRDFENIIIMKVGEKLKGLVEVLSELGLSDKAVLVQKVSQAGEEKIIQGLANLTEAELAEVGYLSTVIVKTGVGG